MKSIVSPQKLARDRGTNITKLNKLFNDNIQYINRFYDQCRQEAKSKM